MFKGDNMLYYCSNCGEKIDDENQKFCIQCGRQLKLNDYQKKLKFVNAENEHLGEHYEMEILSLMEYHDTMIEKYESCHLKIVSHYPQNILCKFKMDFEKQEIVFIPPEDPKNNYLKTPFSIRFSDITGYETLSSGFGICFNEFDWIVLKNRPCAMTLTEILSNIIEYNKEFNKETFKVREAWGKYDILKEEKCLVGFNVAEKKLKLVSLRFNFKDKTLNLYLEKRTRPRPYENYVSSFLNQEISLKNILRFEADERKFKIFYKMECSNKDYMGNLYFRIFNDDAYEKQYIETLKDFLIETIEYNKIHHSENYMEEFETYSEHVDKRKKSFDSRNQGDSLMTYCFNCGAELVEEDQKFCIKCGADLSAERKRREEESDALYNEEIKKREEYYSYDSDEGQERIIDAEESEEDREPIWVMDFKNAPRHPFATNEIYSDGNLVLKSAIGSDEQNQWLKRKREREE